MVVCGLFVGVMACGGSSSADRQADRVRTAALDAGLATDVADFLALASRGRAATFQATYPGPDASTKLVVANRPPDRRVDVVVDGTVTETRLVVDGQAFACPLDADAGVIKTCERTDAVVDPPGRLSAGALDSLTRSLAARLDDYTFRVRSSPIAGVEAICLVTQIRPGRQRPELGASGTICVSHEGALLRIDQAGETLKATDYGTEVPDGTFVRPDRQE